MDGSGQGSDEGEYIADWGFEEAQGMEFCQFVDQRTSGLENERIS